MTLPMFYLSEELSKPETTTRSQAIREWLMDFEAPRCCVWLACGQRHDACQESAVSNNRVSEAGLDV